MFNGQSRKLPRNLVGYCLGLVALASLLAVLPSWAEPSGQATYLGAQACQECHEEQYERFQKYSKKAHSYNSIKIMRKGLTEEEVRKCYECHTTGYNRPGGFRSEGETPGLMNAGCEVCHGPGSLHAQSQDTKQITRRPKIKDCEVCHNAERVGAFRFKPMIYGGAH
ncbi:MAG: cytochrome c family protein [Desulfarculus sp.]|nr:cytochrome c family protein [Desulfarculus sp.]